MEPYEAYKIDFHLFESLFMAISPFSRHSCADRLSVPLFKVALKNMFLLFSNLFIFHHSLSIVFSIIIKIFNGIINGFSIISIFTEEG